MKLLGNRKWKNKGIIFEVAFKDLRNASKIAGLKGKRQQPNATALTWERQQEPLLLYISTSFVCLFIQLLFQETYRDLLVFETSVKFN